jgi:hypothetical protein
MDNLPPVALPLFDEVALGKLDEALRLPEL